ncbi:MAG: DUF882 domain-containing protein [Thermodesulfobacteriota bacterium]
MNRRSFLKLGTLSLAACVFPFPVQAAIKSNHFTRKSLYLFNPHTDESLDVVYYENGRYVSDALEAVNHIFRDYRIDEIKKIHTGLLDYLFAISNQLKLDSTAPFHIVSGYRSPQTNAVMRKRSRKVAKNSYHIKGKAVDIRLPEYSTSLLRKAAMSLSMGGVGYYPKSNFVHVDVGDVRFW